MEKDARDYLHEELSYFEKSAEVQFTHFMQVFYFWTAVVTAPITAGLLVKQGADAFQFALPLILVLIAPLGWFLSAKMFAGLPGRMRKGSAEICSRWRMLPKFLAGFRRFSVGPA